MKFIELTKKILFRIKRVFAEKQTCPRRMNGCGPWEYKKNIDYWHKLPNGDRVCSFCGSMHPDAFEAAINLCLIDVDKCQINTSDKNYKFYVSRPGIFNAGRGGIKFYGQHANTMLDEQRGRVCSKLEKALRVSRIHFNLLMDARKQILIEKHS